MKHICVMLCLMSINATWAQRVVSGVVEDTEKMPLIGATVVVKEKPAIGTTVNTEGKYTLTLPDNKPYTLQVSYIGYITQTREVNARRNSVEDFFLMQDAFNLGTVVVTGTRTPKLLKDAPIVTRVLSHGDIKKADATHIGDLLQSELPGIEFSYSMNQQTSLNMQGFGGNSVLFLVDGERLAGETLDNIDYSRLNMDNVGRVEIVKGAASSLYGSNAVGGVVNIISQDSKEPWSVNLNTRFGANNNQRYGLSVGFNQGIVQSMTNVQHTIVDAIELKNEGDYGTVYGSKTWSVKERLVVTPIEKLKLTGRMGYFFRERNSSEISKERYRDFSGGLKGNYDFGAADNVELSYSFDQYDKSDYQPINDMDVRDYSNVQHTVRGIYNHTFGANNILTLGGDFMRDYLMSYQFSDGGSYTQYTTDAFAQFDWNPTTRVNVITGLRFDHYSEADVKHLSPKAGVMYKFKNFSLRGSYAGGFRAPTLKEMYMNFDMASIFMIYGNKDLKAESSHNFSLSGEYMKGRYNVTVTGFYNIVDNRITTAWNDELKGQVYTNMAKLQVYGVDANAMAKFPCGITARLSYAYTREHIKKGEPLTSSTRPHTATTRIEYGKYWKNYGFNLALNGRFLSKVTTDVYTSSSSYEETERQTYPAYMIWKLSMANRIWKGVNLTLTVDNLFNYVPSYYYSNSPSTTGTTFMAGLSIDIEEFFK